MFNKTGQRGAIFGIDARIAIAIFAMLSMTAGYIALGKLEQVRIANTIKEIQAVDQALKQAQTDMGVFYPQALVESNGYDEFKALWDKNFVQLKFQKLWNGPYFSKTNNDHPIYGSYSLIYKTDSLGTCERNTDCYVYIALSEVPLEDWVKINTIIDEANGSVVESKDEEHLKGRIRTLVKEETVTLLYQSVNKKWKM